MGRDGSTELGIGEDEEIETNLSLNVVVISRGNGVDVSRGDAAEENEEEGISRGRSDEGDEKTSSRVDSNVKSSELNGERLDEVNTSSLSGVVGALKKQNRCQHALPHRGRLEIAHARHRGQIFSPASVGN